MKKEEQLIHQMLSNLQEVSDLQNEHIDDTNYREFYEDAADQLDLYDDEDEDGESDIFKFTYEYLDDYARDRNKLFKLLRDRGLSVEEANKYIQEKMTWEE